MVVLVEVAGRLLPAAIVSPLPYENAVCIRWVWLAPLVYEGVLPPATPLHEHMLSTKYDVAAALVTALLMFSV